MEDGSRQWAEGREEGVGDCEGLCGLRGEWLWEVDLVELSGADRLAFVQAFAGQGYIPCALSGGDLNLEWR